MMTYRSCSSGGTHRFQWLGAIRSQGTLDLLVLTILKRGALHGYAIANHIQVVSEEVLRVEEGSLYPALHRMEAAGWISAEWSMSDNNRRARVYAITRAGRKHLDHERDKWQRLSRAVGKLLRYA
jgi:PadR family transcriptional regulator, regulatory protein PadR